MRNLELKLRSKRWLARTFALPMLILALGGCGHKHAEHEDGHSHGTSANHGHSHGDDAKSFSGATYKDGEGITLLEQTRKVLGIQVHDVEERALPRELGFAARVFAEREHAVRPATDDAGKTWLASGTVPRRNAETLKRGMPVRLNDASGSRLEGTVERVVDLPGPETEVIVSVRANGSQVQFGDFLRVTLELPLEERTTVVPRDAVVRGAEGSFVYVVNGSAYLRTAVQTAAEANGWVEVKDGLLAGDQVVSEGAMDLWLIELRAVKGGQGCCPAPPAKRKA